MTEVATCGEGLAEHSLLPQKLGELTASVAAVLELHMKALDLKDGNSRTEYEAYQKLAHDHRQVANQLLALARQMAGYRQLPMGKHDPEAMSSANVSMTFGEFVRLEEELLALLQSRLPDDRQMLRVMSETAPA
jgi:hypothetical protein